MTVDDYFAFTPFSLKPMELIYGAVRVADSPLPRHQSAVAELFRSLDGHVRSRKLGKIWLSPLDVVLNDRLALDLYRRGFPPSPRRYAAISEKNPSLMH